MVMVSDRIKAGKGLIALHLINILIGAFILFSYPKYLSELLEFLGETGKPHLLITEIMIKLFKPLMSGYFWKITIFLLLFGLVAGAYFLIRSNKIRLWLQLLISA